MTFRMSCPKCGTRNYSITRDVRTSAARDAVAGLVFSCRCGKQMFGELVAKEHERQQREFESSTERRDAEQRARLESAAAQHNQQQRLEEAFEYRREFVARRQAEEAAREEARRRADDHAWRERIAKATGRPPDEVPPAPRRQRTAKTTSPKPTLPVSAPKASPVITHPTVAGGCAWHECDKPARPRSKYCSRECSNKNARYRHKLRRKEEGAAE